MKTPFTFNGLHVTIPCKDNRTGTIVSEPYPALFGGATIPMVIIRWDNNQRFDTIAVTKCIEIDTSETNVSAEEKRHAELVAEVGAELTEMLRAAAQAQGGAEAQVALESVYVNTIPSLQYSVPSTLPNLGKVLEQGLYVGMEPALVFFDSDKLDSLKESLRYLINNPGGVHIQQLTSNAEETNNGAKADLSAAGPASETDEQKDDDSYQDLDPEYVDRVGRYITESLREISTNQTYEVATFILHGILSRIVPKFDRRSDGMPSLDQVLKHGIFADLQNYEIRMSQKTYDRIKEELSFIMASPNMKLTKINFVDEGIMFPEHLKRHTDLVSQYEKEFTDALHKLQGSHGIDDVLTTLTYIYSLTVVPPYHGFDSRKVGLILNEGIYHRIQDNYIHLDTKAVTQIRHYLKQFKL